MIKFRECLFVAILVLCVTAEEEDYKPGYCHDRGIDIKVGKTVSAPIGWCERVTCKISEEGHQSLFAVTCPHFKPRQGCHKSEKDLTKLYPECCPRSVCPDGDE